MEKKLELIDCTQNLTIEKVSYLSPTEKRSHTMVPNNRIRFNKNEFSSPRCVKGLHEMVSTLKKSKTFDNSKSILINNRRIGERLILDKFPFETKSNGKT